MVLNTGCLDWESSALTTRPLLLTRNFYEKELQNTSQEKFRIQKVLKRKGDKLFVKWKEYGNFFNTWINKKDLV